MKTLATALMLSMSVLAAGAQAAEADQGATRAQVQAAAQQPGQQPRAAMALQFKHVFAGVGLRAREKQQQAVVDDFAVVVAEPQVVRMPRLGPAAQQGCADGAAARAAETHDPDAGGTGRRGNRCNRLALGCHGKRFSHG